MSQNYQPRGRYFEDFEVGQRYFSAGRTITEADIVAFAGLSGDYNQIHTDVEFSRQTAFGQRVAHGLLVTAVASGLIAQSGLIEGTVIAFREISKWKFAKPTLIGDTVRVEVEVLDTKALPRLGGGAVEIGLTVLQQDDETVMRGSWTVLILSRPEST